MRATATSRQAFRAITAAAKGFMRASVSDEEGVSLIVIDFHSKHAQLVMPLCQQYFETHGVVIQPSPLQN